MIRKVMEILKSWKRMDMEVLATLTPMEIV